MIGGTDPELTHLGNPWLFRFRPNDSYSARVIAAYVVNTLGKKKCGYCPFHRRLRHRRHEGSSGDSQGHGHRAGSGARLCQQSQDFTPVALALKRSGADVMCSYMTL